MALVLWLPLSDNVLSGEITEGFNVYGKTPFFTTASGSVGGIVSAQAPLFKAGCINTRVRHADIGQEMTVMGLFRFSNFSTSCAAWGSRDGNRGFMLYRNSGDANGYLRVYYWYVSTSGAIKLMPYGSSFNGLVVGKFHHLAISTSKAGELRTYVDGRLTSVVPPPSDFKCWDMTNVDFSFGGNKLTEYLSTDVVSCQDLRIYDEVLSDLTIRDIARVRRVHLVHSSPNVDDSSGFSGGVTTVGTNPNYVVEEVKAFGLRGHPIHNKTRFEINTYIPDDVLTITTWLLLEEYPSQMLLLSVPRPALYIESNGTISAGWPVLSAVTSTDKVPLNEPVLITAIYQTSGMKVYINTKKIIDATCTPEVREKVFIGGAQDGQFCRGWLFEQSYYLTELTLEDITELYHVRGRVHRSGTMETLGFSEGLSRTWFAEPHRVNIVQNQYQMMWGGAMASHADSLDWTDWVEPNKTLGTLFVSGWIYVSDVRYTPRTLEYTIGNNDRGFYVDLNRKTDWVFGWNYVELKDVRYDKPDLTDWSNINRIEVYVDNTTNPVDPGHYIILKDFVFTKFPSNKDSAGIGRNAVMRGKMKEIGYQPSLVDYSTWRLGMVSSSPQGWSVNGSADENYIEPVINPWGSMDLAWVCRNTNVGSDADGGWNGASFPVDNTKTYRFSVWVKREVTGNGTWYLGTSQDGSVAGFDEVPDGNPYFRFGTNAWDNEWFLIVGYVFPHTAAQFITRRWNRYAGLYRADGTKLENIARHFKMLPTTTALYHRAYLYYSSDPNTVQYLYRPRVDCIEDGCPSLEDLLCGVENPNIIHEYGPERHSNNKPRVQGIHLLANKFKEA